MEMDSPPPMGGEAPLDKVCVEEATEMMADGASVVNGGECPIYGVESQRGDGGPSG